MIVAVRPEDLDLVWPSIVEQVSRVTKRFDIGYGVDHVLQQLKENKMQLWLCNGDAIAITEILIMPDFKVMNALMVSGDKMREWLPELVATLKIYGKHYNCKYFEATGRRGWDKMLKDSGFKPHSITTRCQL